MDERKMKILENLWRVGGSGITAAEDAAVYLIRFELITKLRRIRNISRLAVAKFLPTTVRAIHPVHSYILSE